MQKYFYVPIGAGIALILVIFVLPEITKAKYSLDVDAIKDEVDVAGLQARVKLTNTGRLPLTNIVIDFDNSDIQRLPFLEPGKTMLISPKPDTEFFMVRVTTDEGIAVTREFRMPAEVPGLPHGIG